MDDVKTNTIRTIIIPDIHTKFKIAESMIKRESPDRIVFLGDYFDTYDETEQDTRDTARWLAMSLEQSNRIHLVGNHDLHYMTSNPAFICSGFSEFKKHIVDSYNISWNKMTPYCYVGNYLCTHAGISKQFFEEYGADSLMGFMEQSVAELTRIDDVYAPQKFFQVGVSRGGPHKNGGIVWCDYNEFTDIPGIRQMFGHTRDSEVRQNKDHICLDTVLHHYAIYQGNEMTIREF